MSITLSWKSSVFGLIYLISFCLALWQPDRSEFYMLLAAYSICFGSYLLLIQRKWLPHRGLLILALTTILCSFFFEPHLSNDYYRFLWDGELLTLGINPYDATPDYLIQTEELLNHSFYFKELHVGMGELSSAHFSCYPTVNQFYFATTAFISDSIVVNVAVMRLLILITVILGGWFLWKILKLLKLDSHRIWILYLNPLWGLETFGNLHFEAVMVSLLFIGLYFLIKTKDVVGGLFFASAIQIKLIPLMLLPNLFRFLGLKRALIFYGACILFVAGFAFSLLTADNVMNFRESLSLYFNSFEFNSFLMYPISEVGKAWTGNYELSNYSALLSQISLVLLAFIAFYGQVKTWNQVLVRMTWGLFIYLLLTSTVHPWYVVTLLGLSILTRYSFVLIWTLTVFLSYQFYSHWEYHSDSYRLLVVFEYLVVIIVALFELIKGKSLLHYFSTRK